jgi:class 3 adenylate cyclase
LCGSLVTGARPAEASLAWHLVRERIRSRVIGHGNRADCGRELSGRRWTGAGCGPRGATLEEFAIEQPTTTRTFLMTDIEGSTRLWEDHPEAWPRTLAALEAMAPVIELLDAD